MDGRMPDGYQTDKRLQCEAKNGPFGERDTHNFKKGWKVFLFCATGPFTARLGAHITQGITKMELVKRPLH